MSATSIPSDPSRIFGWCGVGLEGSAAATLLALDRQLGDIVRTTAQPLIGQMRLTWWYEALVALDTAPPPAAPLLVEVADRVVNAGVPGATLAAMCDGWELLLGDEALDAATITQFARARGATLFRAVACATGNADAPLVEEAGALWSLADLAAHVADEGLRDRARQVGLSLGARVFAARWSRARELGALALDAQAALLARGDADGPRRAAAVARFRLLGR